MGPAFPWTVHELWQWVLQVRPVQGFLTAPFTSILLEQPSAPSSAGPLGLESDLDLLEHFLLSFHGYSQAYLCFIENEEIAHIFVLFVLYWLCRKVMG